MFFLLLRREAAAAKTLDEDLTTQAPKEGFL